MKLFYSTRAMLVSLILGVSGTAFGQSDLSHDQLIGVVHELKTSITYGPRTKKLVHELIQGMISDGGYGASALKKRLLNGMTWNHLNTIAAFSDPKEASLLKLMMATQQYPIGFFITDVDLADTFGQDGRSLKQSEDQRWAKMPQNLAANASWIQVFEAYEPETVQYLVAIIAAPCVNSSNVEDWPDSWASQSLWNVYLDMRTYELGKESVVMRLLDRHGYIDIPDFTKAEFAYSHMPDRIMDLRFYHWTSADVPTLKRLKTNPFYGAWAKELLTTMGL